MCFVPFGEKSVCAVCRSIQLENVQWLVATSRVDTSLTSISGGLERQEHVNFRCGHVNTCGFSFKRQIIV
ncbi:hypothetical protein TNCT_108631 [Trichonephila clavata]|uniref:Uncharacterized protein n=1 Tax=Trichonephila clavata TaxID=2740835 RepID=A0A8X6F847_TRICU|nr:hypothetical protein TNCT_108631 [Trichonephila clavata]